MARAAAVGAPSQPLTGVGTGIAPCAERCALDELSRSGPTTRTRKARDEKEGRFEMGLMNDVAGFSGVGWARRECTAALGFVVRWIPERKVIHRTTASRRLACVWVLGHEVSPPANSLTALCRGASSPPKYPFVLQRPARSSLEDAPLTHGFVSKGKDCRRRTWVFGRQSTTPTCLRRGTAPTPLHQLGTNR